MWNKQIILILCMLYIGSSIAKSFRPTSFDYDYREESRKASNNYRGKSVTTTPRPSLQSYWDSFVNNIPTLPPLRWNMTNSFSNLFSNAQQIMETPVVMHDIVEQEPNRRRKSSKTKKNKNRKRSQSKVRSSYYNYPTPGYHQNDEYQQIQLQPMGLDARNIMHFYEPTTGNYYAMQMISNPYNQNNYYNNHEEYKNNSDETNEDDEYYHEEGYDEKEQNQDDNYDAENMIYDNEQNDDAQHESQGEEDYADDVVVADNWGYTDDEVVGDRKLKGSSSVIKPEMVLTESNIVKIQKHLLKPESEDDVMVLLSNTDRKTNSNRLKPTEEMEVESVRNILGTFMKDDIINRRRQSANTKQKQTTRLVEKPRQQERYYIFPANFWLK